MHLDENNQFVSAKGPTGVYATKTPKGRWQFRMGSLKSDTLLASGITPAQFVKSFWYRDDFQG